MLTKIAVFDAIQFGMYYSITGGLFWGIVDVLIVTHSDTSCQGVT